MDPRALKFVAHATAGEILRTPWRFIAHTVVVRSVADLFIATLADRLH